MSTTEKKEEKPALNIDAEKKREVISFQVSPSEKREITFKAIKECGCTVSEFIRAKIFMEPKKIEVPVTSEAIAFDDEERLIYEDKLKELTDENKVLKDKLINERILKTTIDPNGIVLPKENEGNNISIFSEPEFKSLLDKIKAYRDEKLASLDEEDKAKYYDFNTFLKLMFLRGVQRSYFSSDLKNSTGLQLSDFDSILEVSKINPWDI